MRLLALLALALQAATQAASPAPPPTAEDLAHGKKLFRVHCASCHGFEGGGGRGPSLASATFRKVTDDKSLLGVILQGIEDSDMPAAWMLSEAEARRITAYVRSLAGAPATPVAGDVARGRALYEGKGACGVCHVVAGRGEALGPELTEVGLRRSADFLSESLLKPAASLPEGFLMVSVVARDGKEVTGVRVNEDSFTIQIKDLSYGYHSFRKSDLKELDRMKGSTPMISYATTFKPAEIEDLVAYMASLRGAN
jgi:putative heme-binding domain-containing protein